jgi:class 3 adenylate cyclase
MTDERQPDLQVNDTIIPEEAINLDQKLAVMLSQVSQVIKDQPTPKKVEFAESSQNINQSQKSMKDLDPVLNKVFDNESDDEDNEDGFIEESKVVSHSSSHKRRNWQKKASKFANIVLSNFFVEIIITVFTTFILFGDFLRIMLFRQQSDIYFDVFVIISIVIFSVEFVLNIIASRKYVYSMYFWMDMIMCVLIVLNISSISNAIFYSANEKVTKITVKIAKFLRLVRLVRFLKYFQKNENTFKKVENERTKVADKIKTQTRMFKPRESKVTSELKNLNIMRLIILILVMWILIPLFDFSIFTNPRTNTNQDKISLLLFNLLRFPEETPTYIDQIQTAMEIDSQFVSRLSIKGIVDYTHEDFPNLRQSDQVMFTDIVNFMNVDYDCEFYVSVRYEAIIQALLDLINTLLLGFIMVLSIWNLNRDVSQLILNPLERMIQKIKLVSMNPLVVLKKKEIPFVKDNEMNETLVIEEAINKISELLMLGFGNAGCRIISNLLFEMDHGLDELFHGEKTYAIFGFCYIMDFTTTTEVLQEDVMLFVNTIAEIVHCSVDEFSGAANKNIGDAFLIVWKLMDDAYKFFHDNEFKSRLTSNKMETSKLKEIDYSSEDTYNRQLAELSLLSFIQVIIRINTSAVVKDFSRHPKILKHMPNFSVKMGFGLHLGWAIEGAIGSSFKIDASYLSPNVNMAARLEAATKQFGVDILFSGPLYDLFTNRRIIELCRHLDTVMVKGSKQPMRLYTIDLNVKNLVENQSKFLLKEKRHRALQVEQTDNLKENFKVLSKKIKTVEESPLNPNIYESHISKMQSVEEDTIVNKKLNSTNFRLILDSNNIVSRDYRQRFKFALNAYLDGDWKLAKKLFEKCFQIKIDDKPSHVLYRYMEHMNFESPADWKHCRELTEK